MFSWEDTRFYCFATRQTEIYCPIDMKWIWFPPKINDAEQAPARQRAAAQVRQITLFIAVRAIAGSDPRPCAAARAQQFWSGVYARHGGSCWQHLQEWSVRFTVRSVWVEEQRWGYLTYMLRGVFYVDICQFFQRWILKASKNLYMNIVNIHDHCGPILTVLYSQ